MNFRKITLLFLLLLAAPLVAQPKITVVSFEENLLDMSAREKPTSRDDGTGALYSIIKVRSTNPEDDLKAYELDFEYLKDVQEMHNGVLWVYVQNGAKTVTINREGYRTVERYNLKTTLQPGKVYDLTLSAEERKVKKQMVMFRVSPADADAVIMYGAGNAGNETVLGRTDDEGVVAKSLPLGRYSYKIISESCYPSEGIFTLDNVAETHIETVTLRPNFSKTTLNAGEGVEIYIDGVKMGIGVWSGNLNAGSYNVECRKAGHKSANKTLTVVEGEAAVVELPRPTPLTGVLALTSTPINAKITIDGKDCGLTPRNVTGLLVGEHKVELSKEGYAPAEVDVVIYEDETTEQSVVLQRGEAKKSSVAKSNTVQRGSSSNRKTISGTVIDKLGNPLAGAKVQVIGSALNGVADEDGNFSIDVPLHSKSLSFKAKGTVPKKLKLGSSSSDNNIVEMKRAQWFVNLVCDVKTGGGNDTNVYIGLMAGWLGNWGGYLKVAPNLLCEVIVGTPAVTLGVTKRLCDWAHLYLGMGAAPYDDSYWVYKYGYYKLDHYGYSFAMDFGCMFKPTRHFNINVGFSMYAADPGFQIGVGYSF